jgi:hypothetical protein
MTPETVAQLFQPFTQADALTHAVQTCCAKRDA